MNFPETENKTGGKYIRLKSGEKIVGIFQGDAVLFKQHWVDGKSSTCNPGSCQACSSGEKATEKFQMNFLTQEDGIWVAKVFEHTTKTMNTLKNFHKEYDLSKTLVTLSKQGEKMTTLYMLLPSKKNLTEVELAQVKRVPLNNLEKATPKAPPTLSSQEVGGPY